MNITGQPGHWTLLVSQDSEIILVSQDSGLYWSVKRVDSQDSGLYWSVKTVDYTSQRFACIAWRCEDVENVCVANIQTHPCLNKTMRKSIRYR